MHPLMPQPKVYLVFWGSQWGPATQSGNNLTFSNDPASAAPYVQNFLRGLFGAGDTCSTSTDQYCQGKGVAKGPTTCPPTATFVHHPTKSPLAGVWADGAAAAPVQASDAQLGQEADNAAVHFGNSTPKSNKSAPVGASDLTSGGWFEPAVRTATSAPGSRPERLGAQRTSRCRRARSPSSRCGATSPTADTAAASSS